MSPYRLCVSQQFFESMPSPLASHCSNLQHLTVIHYRVAFESTRQGDFTPHPKNPFMCLNFFSAWNHYKNLH